LTGTVNPIHIIFFNRDGEGAHTSLSPYTGTLERYSHLEDIKEHAKRWKSRREGRQPEDSSPEIQRPRDKRMEGLLLYDILSCDVITMLCPVVKWRVNAIYAPVLTHLLRRKALKA
jgi:hypothetical protein